MWIKIEDGCELPVEYDYTKVWTNRGKSIAYVYTGSYGGKHWAGDDDDRIEDPVAWWKPEPIPDYTE